MGKPNKTQVLIKQELQTRQAELVQIETAIQQGKQELAQLEVIRLKTAGALEQLTDLLGEKT